MNDTTTMTIDALLAAGHRRVRLPEWDPRAYAEAIPGDHLRIRVVTPEYHQHAGYPMGVPPWSGCVNSQAWTIVFGMDQARDYTGWVAARARQRTRPRGTRPGSAEDASFGRWST